MSQQVARLAIVPFLLVAALQASPAAAQAPPVTPGKTGTAGGVAYNALVNGQQLKPTEFIRSPNGKFGLRFRKDGQLTLYSGSQLIWANGVTSPTPLYFQVGNTGCASYQDNPYVKVFWQVKVRSYGTYLAVQDDGNVVLYDHTGWPYWDRKGHVALGTTVEAPKPPAPTQPLHVVQASGSVSNVAYNGVLDCAYLPGQLTPSPNGQYWLVYQTDGNLVMYYLQRPLWSSGTFSSTPQKAVFKDGNMTIFETKNAQSVAQKTAFATSTTGTVLAVQDDGNLVVYRRSDMKPLWAIR